MKKSDLRKAMKRSGKPNRRAKLKAFVMQGEQLVDTVYGNSSAELDAALHLCCSRRQDFTLELVFENPAK